MIAAKCVLWVLQLIVLSHSKSIKNLNLIDEEHAVPNIYEYTIQSHDNNYSTASHELINNTNTSQYPVSNIGFVVLFLVDEKGGSMRSCRHSDVRVIVPPKCAKNPMLITCQYVDVHRLTNPPPLTTGQALASRVLELEPKGASFLGPVLLEIPHFASLRGKEREIIVLRSDDGKIWKEHTSGGGTFNSIQYSLNRILGENGKDSRIIRILTYDFPHYFAIVARIRQDVSDIGPGARAITSSLMSGVQVIYPKNGVSKNIRFGLQVELMEPELVKILLENDITVSPVVTINPRGLTLNEVQLRIPSPRVYDQNTPPSLRLCTSTKDEENTTVWSTYDDVYWSTRFYYYPLKNIVWFRTKFLAAFWLIDCPHVDESVQQAVDVYAQFSVKRLYKAIFVAFAKRISSLQALVGIFCLIDDKWDTHFEHDEHFFEIARSQEVELLEGQDISMKVSGNLIPFSESSYYQNLTLQAFSTSGYHFMMVLKNIKLKPSGRITFMTNAENSLCTLNLNLLKDIAPDFLPQSDFLSSEEDHCYSPNGINKQDYRFGDICNILDNDWAKLAADVGILPSKLKRIKADYPHNNIKQAIGMFSLWLEKKASNKTVNQLKRFLNMIGRQDTVSKCICNVEPVSDNMKKQFETAHWTPPDLLDDSMETLDYRKVETSVPVIGILSFIVVLLFLAGLILCYGAYKRARTSPQVMVYQSQYDNDNENIGQTKRLVKVIAPSANNLVAKQSDTENLDVESGLGVSTLPFQDNNSSVTTTNFNEDDSVGLHRLVAVLLHEAMDLSPEYDYCKENLPPNYEEATKPDKD